VTIIEGNTMAVLTGRTALVTGGSRGIGAAIVRRLASEGTQVVFTYAAAEDAANALVDSVTRDGGTVSAIKANSAHRGEVVNAVATAVERLGYLDIVVSNAGGGVLLPLSEIGYDEIDRMINVTVYGTVTLVKESLPHLREGGRVITIGSVNSHYKPFDSMAIHALDRAALVGFVRGMARELGPKGITINNVQPGPVDTDANPANGPTADLQRSLIPIGRYGEAVEVASLVSYLAGPESSLMTGASLDIDGGYSA
jgi:3-oxoacyl-[acyl-carrier protein] reductase